MTGKRAERLQVMLTIDEVRRVEEWRFENRMPSRSAAVRALMNLGLHAGAPLVDESAMLEGAVSSRDVGVVDNGSVVAGAESAAVLVVADDVLVGHGIARLLEAAGFRVIGPISGREQARSLATDADIAAAVIDPAEEAPADTAERLSARGVPVLLLGADDATDALPGKHGAAAVMKRDEAGEDLARRIAGLLA